VKKRFDKIKLAEAPLKGVAHNNDLQTFVVIAPNPNAVLIEGSFYLLKAQLETDVVFMYLQHNSFM